MKQKRKLGRKVLSFLLSLALVLGLMPGMSLTAYAAGVSYVDGSGTSQTEEANVLAAGTTNWTDGSWYIVPEGGLTISGRIAVNGTVNLILRDGATLTASAGITVTEGNTLNIYAQSAGTGALSARGANGGNGTNGGNAGIGSLGAGYEASAANCGTINIYGGTITATGGNGDVGTGAGAGIGGGGLGYYSKGGGGCGTVSIYGGIVTATGGNGASSTSRNFRGGGAGIGGGGGAGGYAVSGTGGTGGTVSIYGGTVTATGGSGMNTDTASGIGGGSAGLAEIAGAAGTLTLGKGVKLYDGTNNTGTVLDNSDSASRSYSGSRVKTMFAEYQYTGPDKSALNDAITAAQTLYDSIKDNTDYADIAGTLKTAIDTAQGVYDNADADQDAVDGATTTITTAKTTAVVGMINKLPAASDVTTSDKGTIEAVRAAYASLSETEQGKVDADTLKKLTDAETALATAEVKAAIEALPAAKDVTVDYKDAVQAAKAAYDKLSDAQKEAVGNDAKAKLDACTTALAIAELPAADSVTTANKDAIEAARAAYDALTDAQKTAVGTDALAKLEACEVSLVNKMIEALPAATDVTTADKDAIEAARAAYVALSEAQKAAVGNDAKAKLEACEAALANIEVTNVQTLINNLPSADSVTTANKDAIEAARAAYDALTDAQKTTVGEAARQKLEGVEVALVNKTIEALPEAASVTTANKTAIEAARAAYVALSDTQKTDVGDEAKAKLEACEAALAIVQLPEAASVTTANKTAIEAARAKYDALSEAQKTAVGNDAKAKLEACEAALAIVQLPEAASVTTANKTAIEAARAKYDALTDTQKQSISADTLKKLTDAEEKLVILKVMSEVSAKTGSGLNHTGNPIQLINAPTTELPTGYTMYYAIGDSETTAPDFDGTSQDENKKWSTSIPTGTNVGTYYVWYKAVGDGNHSDTAPACVKVTISQPYNPPSPPATITIPVSGDAASVDLTVQVSGTTATVTGADVESVLSAEKVGTVTVDVNSLQGGVNEVVLPNGLLTKIATAVANPNNDASGMAIKLPTGTVSFDAAAVAAIAAQADGKDLKFHLDGISLNTLTSAQQGSVGGLNVMKILDAYMTADGVRISDFQGGSATVSVSNPLQAGQKPAGVVVWFVAENGEKSEVASQSDGKNTRFDIWHLSNYVIAYDAARAEKPESYTYDSLTDEEKAQADALIAAYGTKEPLDKDTAAQMIKWAQKLGVPFETLLLTDEVLTNLPDDSDPAGSTFGKLTARATKRAKKSLTLQWKKFEQADGYLIYGNLCGKTKKLKLKKDIKGNGTLKWTQKKLKKGKYYKYMVVAYKNVGDKKMTLAASVVVHATTKGAKFTIAKSVKVKPTSVTLEIGQTAKLKASEVKAEKGKKIKRHRPVKYESDNLSVATVAPDGTITAVGEGSTVIYVYAQNGLYKTVTVTVTPGQVVPNSVEEPETEADALENDSLTVPDVDGEEILLDDVIIEDTNDPEEIEAEIILEDNAMFID